MKGRLHIRLLTCFAGALLSGASDAAEVRLLDERLELVEFVPSPGIRTPIGIAIDRRDRIFVVESHTHHPPKDYPGPDHDIIKLYRDSDYDGRPDSATDFASGIRQAMNLALSPGGVLHVVCAREVWALRDDDEDGNCEWRERVLHVETENTYAHSCQMGITFDQAGWMYISRGNNGGRAYRVVGTDGTSLAGFGDGGDVYRCRLDGSQLERIATGFWNPFEVRVDPHGRLLALDNDPDARGPNRLVHVVPGGDYGYKSVHGGEGNHPFQGWDGDLPGTLPYVVGVGEAPCGLFICDQAALPPDYSGHYLAAIWNENQITRIVPRPRGASITAETQPWLVGDQDFRPVAMAADSRGNIYITDWVKVAYPNHGEGRIWRVSTKGNDHPKKPRPLISPTSPPKIPARAMSARQDLASDDPFLRHAAVVALARDSAPEEIEALLSASDARIRLGALLALRRTPSRGAESTGLLRRMLSDPDEHVRRLTLMWIGEAGLLPLAEELERALRFPGASAELFAAYIAALELLDRDYIAGIAARAGVAKKLPRGDASDAILRVLKDLSHPPHLRAHALIQLGTRADRETLELFRRIARQDDPVLQKEAIRSLAAAGSEETELFLKLAENPTNAPLVRAEAIAALANSPSQPGARLAQLQADADTSVALAARRALRPLDAIPERNRPTTPEAWEQRLATGGNAEAGERVFFSSRTQCAACHRVNLRGRRIGPDLSNLGQSLSRKQIVRAIVRPSDSFAPQFQAWFVDLQDDESYVGLQLDHRAGGDIEMFTTEGITRHFNARDILRYGVMERSLMPEGLEATMTVEEFRDLVAFLQLGPPGASRSQP